VLKRAVFSSIHKGVRPGRDETGDGGFTLVELLIALVILAIVLAALAPMFYGLLRASATTDERSVANGIAVAATEQIRSIPYDEIGYPSSWSGTGCPGTNPVVLPSTVPSPLAGMSGSQTIGNVTYTITRCVYWVNSSVPGDSLAYKQSVVTVRWTANGVAGTVSQTSAIYPGGYGTYSQTTDDHAPTGSATGSGGTTPPSPPSNLGAQDDPTTPATIIDLSWQTPSSSPTAVTSYTVVYTASSGSSSPFSGTTADLNGSYAVHSNVPASNCTGTSQSSPCWNPTLSSSTQYWFEVFSVASDGTTSVIASNAATATTSNAPQTCNVSQLTVSPSTATVDRNDLLTTTNNVFNLSVNSQNGCSSVTVAYQPLNDGNVLYANMTGSGNLLTGTAGSCTQKWSAGNHVFTVYVAGTEYNPSSPVTQQVAISLNNGNSVHC
jgi:prepilin-type N-terminal cleavage/methylation domain-containing protein